MQQSLGCGSGGRWRNQVHGPAIRIRPDAGSRLIEWPVIAPSSAWHSITPMIQPGSKPSSRKIGRSEAARKVKELDEIIASKHGTLDDSTVARVVDEPMGRHQPTGRAEAQATSRPGTILALSFKGDLVPRRCGAWS
jgi:hypothetical protein